MSKAVSDIPHQKLQNETEEDLETPDGNEKSFHPLNADDKSPNPLSPTDQLAKPRFNKQKIMLLCLSLILTFMLSCFAYVLKQAQHTPAPVSVPSGEPQPKTDKEPDPVPFLPPRDPLPVPPPPKYSEPYSFSYEPINALPLKFSSQNPIPLDEIKKLNIKENEYIPNLQLQAQIYNQNHLSVQIRDANHQRYEIPNMEPFPHPRNSTLSSTTKDSPFELEVDREATGFRVRRKSSNEVIFELCEKIVYTDKYLQFTFKPPTKELYGLGERLGPMQLRPGDYTIFLYDRIGEIDTGESGKNQQGQHPMYLMRENSGLYHVFLLRNMSPGEVKIHEDGTLTWKLIGGIFDFNFFMGTDPESALELYHNYIGGWPLPALWHFGYHQNRWNGYMSVKDLENVMIRFQELEIPLEGLWNDLDYQKNMINFSFDDKNFPEKEIEELYAKYDKRWIALIDPLINKELLTHESQSVQSNLVMHDSLDQLCEGVYMWQYVVFLDFLHPECRTFWQDKMEQLWSKWSFSGVWLDANEVSNHDPRDNKNYTQNLFYDMPYHPGGVNFFDLKLINPDCRHYDGSLEMDARVWNSVFQAQYSFEHLKKLHSSKVASPDHKTKMFPFVLSRALPMGAGQFVVHWIPDVWSNWESLRASFSNILGDGMFGTPMTGTDICGFVGRKQTEPELCARWHQVAMFYPFARNSHAPFGEGNNQEPYTYKGKHRQQIIGAIQNRYSILKYLYTQFFLRKSPQSPTSSIHRVGSVLKPLFLLFSDDVSLPPYMDLHNEEQAMFGDSIMIAPVMYPSVDAVNVYFPDRRWYDLRFETEVPVRAGNADISATLDEGCPFFLKGGSIFYSQDVAKVLNSRNLDNNFKLVAGLSDWQEVRSGANSTRVASSQGSIMTVSDYEEVTVYNSCVLDNCLMTIQVEFIDDKRQPTLKMSAKLASSTNEYDGTVGFTELKVLGVPKRLNGHRLVSVSNETVHSHLIESTLQDSKLVLAFNKQLPFPVDQEYVFTFSKP